MDGQPPRRVVLGQDRDAFRSISPVRPRSGSSPLGQDAPGRPRSPPRLTGATPGLSAKLSSNVLQGERSDSPPRSRPLAVLAGRVAKLSSDTSSGDSFRVVASAVQDRRGSAAQEAVVTAHALVQAANSRPGSGRSLVSGVEGVKKKPKKDSDEETYSLEKKGRKKKTSDAGLLGLLDGDFDRANSGVSDRPGVQPGRVPRRQSVAAQGHAAAKTACEAQLPGLKWGEMVLPPKSGVPLTNAGLAAALQRQVLAFTQEELAKFKVANLSYESFIKVGDKYFRPVAVENEEEDVDWEAEAELARLQWMSQLQLPGSGGGGQKLKLMCMHGCHDDATMRPAVVTHVCRQCKNFLCKLCMHEHAVDPRYRHHELGTHEELQLSRFRSDGWNTRGMQRMGLGEDDETLRNLGRVFALQKVHRVVDGCLVAMSPTAALKADSGHDIVSRTASSCSGSCIQRTESSGSGSRIQRTASSSSRNSSGRPVSRDSDDFTVEWIPDKTDFLHPPRRPISPLFRNKGRSMSPQRSPDAVVDKDTSGARGQSKLQSSMDNFSRAVSHCESGTHQKDSEAAGGETPNNVYDMEERARIARKTWRQQSTEAGFSKTMGSFQLKTDRLAPSTAAGRSISPVRVGTRMSAATKVRAQSSSPVREDGALGKNESSKDVKNKPMSDFYSRVQMTDDSGENAGKTETVAVAVPACLRRAMTHSFITRDMEMHGNKCFFEFRRSVFALSKRNSICSHACAVVINHMLSRYSTCSPRVH